MSASSWRLSSCWRHRRGVSSRRLHGVKKQRAVLSLCSCEDGWERLQRALWQGTASPQVEGDDLLVQAQLAGDAVERLRVQIQDGDQGRESRRSGGEEVPEPPLTGGGGGGGVLMNRKKGD